MLIPIMFLLLSKLCSFKNQHNYYNALDNAILESNNTTFTTINRLKLYYL